MIARTMQVCVLNKVPAGDRKVIEETFEHHLEPLGKARPSRVYNHLIATAGPFG